MHAHPLAQTPQVFGHGFLTKDGLKMGKALGNTLDPSALVAMYGPDAVRLYFMKEVGLSWCGMHLVWCVSGVLGLVGVCWAGLARVRCGLCAVQH
jgi:leucyl-tRNA synthetase